MRIVTGRKTPGGPPEIVYTTDDSNAAQIAAENGLAHDVVLVKPGRLLGYHMRHGKSYEDAVAFLLKEMNAERLTLQPAAPVRVPAPAPAAKKQRPKPLFTDDEE